ncbi:unnamed protein product [Discula destructiva]
MTTPEQFWYDPFAVNDDFNMMDSVAQAEPVFNFDQDELLDPSLASVYPELNKPMIYFDEPVAGVLDTIETSPKTDSITVHTKGNLVQRTLVQTMTPPTSLSPDRPDAAPLHPDPLENSNVPRQPTKRKRNSEVSERGGETGDLAPDENRKAKNRVAATKCRLKKKAWQQQQEQIQEALREENEEMKRVLRELTEERLQLKNEVLKHSQCNDPTINRWLSKSAAGLVNNAANQPVFHSHFHSGISAAQMQLPPAPQIVYGPENAQGRRDSIVSAQAHSRFNGGSPSVAPSVECGSPLALVAMDASDSPMQLPLVQDSGSMAGESMMRSRSGTMDVLADLAISRAGSQIPASSERNEPSSARDEFNQNKHDSTAPSPVLIGRNGVMDNVEAAPSNAPLSLNPTAMNHRRRQGSRELYAYSPKMGAAKVSRSTTQR